MTAFRLLLETRILHAALVLVPCSAAQAGVILLYHHVDESTPAITSIAPDQFKRHLNILEQEGFRVVTLDALLAQSREGPADARLAAITFDDAYQSTYRTAYPLLQARGWPFTIFVATDLVQDNHPLYLSWDELQEMSANGAHIANHTHTHAHLVRQSEDEDKAAWLQRVRGEITTAGQQLIDHDMASDYFAYPYGEYNPDVLAIVGSLGLTGFGQQSGAVGPQSNSLLLPRFPLAGIYAGEAAFRDKIRSLAMPVRHPDVNPILTDNFKPPLPLEFTNDDVSLDRLTCYGPGGLMAIAETGQCSIVVTPQEPVNVGRSRYNCTLPAGNGRYYWFSQLWIRKRPDGSWYPEP